MSIDLKNKIYESLLVLIIFSLSFSKALPNIFLALSLLFYFIFMYKKEDGIDKKYYLNFISGLLLFLFFKKFFSQSILEEYKSLGRFAIIIALPILFSKISKIKIIISYVTTVFISVFLSTIKIFLYYTKYKSLPFSNNAEVNDLLCFERPYMGFACLTSSLLLIYLIKEIPRHKFFLILLSIFLISFIFLIAARLSIITILFLLIYYLFFYSNFSLVNKVILFTTVILMLIYVLFNYKNLSNRFFFKSNVETIIDYEPRLVIWPCTIEIVKLEQFNCFLGGKNDFWIEENLINCYNDKIIKKSKRDWFIESKFNSHSQYLDFFLKGGLIAFILFLLFSIFLLIFNSNNFYTFAIAVSIIFFFLVENVLYRQFGVYVLAILLSILDKIINDKSKSFTHL